MKTKILVLMCFFSLAACKVDLHNDDDKKSDGNKQGETTRGNSEEKTKDVTDYSICNTARKTSIEGAWQQVQQSEHVDIVFTLQIGRASSRATVDCKMAGRTLRASVTSPSSYTNDTFTIAKADKDEKKIEEPDFKMNCSASLSAATLKYEFQGACLVMTMNGERQMLAPATF